MVVRQLRAGEGHFGYQYTFHFTPPFPHSAINGFQLCNVWLRFPFLPYFSFVLLAFWESIIMTYLPFTVHVPLGFLGSGFLSLCGRLMVPEQKVLQMNEDKTQDVVVLKYND